MQTYIINTFPTRTLSSLPSPGKILTSYNPYTCGTVSVKALLTRE